MVRRCSATVQIPITRIEVHEHLGMFFSQPKGIMPPSTSVDSSKVS